MKTLVIIILSLALFPPSHGQEKKKEHPIDVALEKAMEKDYSTAGMIQALGKAQEAWDAELNKNYKKLLTLLKDDGKKKLREAQRAWVAFSRQGNGKPDRDLRKQSRDNVAGDLRESDDGDDTPAGEKSRELRA